MYVVSENIPFSTKTTLIMQKLAKLVRLLKARVGELC